MRAAERMLSGISISSHFRREPKTPKTDSVQRLQEHLRKLGESQLPSEAQHFVLRGRWPCSLPQLAFTPRALGRV